MSVGVNGFDFRTLNDVVLSSDHPGCSVLCLDGESVVGTGFHRARTWGPLGVASLPGPLTPALRFTPSWRAQPCKAQALVLLIPTCQVT